MIESANFIACCAIRIVPNVFVSRTEAIQSVLDLNRLAMISDSVGMAILTTISVSCRYHHITRGTIVKQLSTEEHLSFSFKNLNFN